MNITIEDIRKYIPLSATAKLESLKIYLTEATQSLKPWLGNNLVQNILDKPEDYPLISSTFHSSFFKLAMAKMIPVVSVTLSTSGITTDREKTAFAYQQKQLYHKYHREGWNDLHQLIEQLEETKTPDYKAHSFRQLPIQSHLDMQAFVPIDDFYTYTQIGRVLERHFKKLTKTKPPDYPIIEQVIYTTVLESLQTGALVYLKNGTLVKYLKLTNDDQPETDALLTKEIILHYQSQIEQLEKQYQADKNTTEQAPYDQWNQSEDEPTLML